MYTRDNVVYNMLMLVMARYDKTGSDFMQKSEREKLVDLVTLKKIYVSRSINKTQNDEVALVVNARDILERTHNVCS